MTIRNSILRVSQKLDIFDESPETMEKRTFVSRVEEVDDEFVLILPPFLKGSPFFPRVGEALTAKIVFNSVPYYFETSLVRYRRDPFPLWEISLPENVRKVQLREHVRLNLVLNTTIEVLTSMSQGKVIKTISKDISAGGLQGVFPHFVPIGTKLNISVPLPNSVVVESTGQIVRLIPPSSKVDKLMAGIKFIDLEEKMKDQITKFVFAKDLEMRRRERECKYC